MSVPGIVTFRKNNRRFIRCDVCCKSPLIVKQFVSKKPPAITTSNGTRYRKLILEEHIKKSYHLESLAAERIASLKLTDTVEFAPMDIAINKANEKMLNYVGKLCIQVYNDAKHLNLTAWSWPSRFVAANASNVYDFNQTKQKETIIPSDLTLQYVNPPGHLELLSTIVKSHQKDFEKKITDCLAISLRIDGSIDLTQMDKIYVMGKIINLDGSLELVFFGIGEQKKRFANGLMDAVKEALNQVIDNPDIIFKKVSSICTDGANINIGEKNSLWTLLEAEIRKSGSDIPLNKVWCAAHRAELAWKDTSKKVSAINKLLLTLSSISSYFHHSSIRTAELKEIAIKYNLRLLSIPKIFEVRWSHFTFNFVA